MAPARPSRPSDAAVERATGASWSEWIDRLDRRGAKAMTHKDLAALLHEEFGLSGWWSQSVAVEYERASGVREVGQAAGGFQVGVRRGCDASVDEAWSLILSPGGLRVWLGGGGRIKVEAGRPFRLKDGTTGEFRVVRPGDVVRVRWQPPEWERPSTIQVRVLPRAGGRSAILFHQEGLPDAAAREAMRARWEAVLERLGCGAG